MSSVVFDEEQREIRKDREITAVRDQAFGVLTPTARRTTVGQKFMMLLFAGICVGISFAIFTFKPSDYPIPALYKESATKEVLRLVPERDRATFINSLPSIENK